MSFLSNTAPTAGTQKYIVPLGDSITAGYSNQYLVVPNYQLYNGGYRILLHQVAMAANKRITLLGGQLFNSVGMNNRNHEGVSGQVINQIHGRIAAMATSYTPNVILLHAGTNDFYYFVAPPNTEVTTIQARYTAMLDTIFTRWPSVIIVCAKLGPWFNIIGGTDGPIFATMNGLAEKTAFNAYIAALPATHIKGSQIRVVTMETYMDVSNKTGDGLHPNAWGYQNMAWGWWSALSLLV